MQKKWIIMMMLTMLLTITACSISAPVAEVPRANVLQVPYVEKGDVDPLDSSWDGTVPLNVPLTGMDIKGEWPITLTPAAQVSALRDSEQIYFKLSWADTTKDDVWVDTNSFMDAAAVQLPVKSGSEPYICMGQENEMVNILYWRAGEDKGENMLGGGYGSLTSLGRPELPVKASYGNQRWTTVIVRPLAEVEKNVLTGSQMTAAFAVWNGSDQQRGGRKSTSQWITLSFEQPGA